MIGLYVCYGGVYVAIIQYRQQASSTFQNDATMPLRSLRTTQELDASPVLAEAALPGKYAVFRAYSSTATTATMNCLQRRERVVFALLDGRRAIQDVTRLIHQSDMSVARIIVQLYQRGYVEYLRG